MRGRRGAMLGSTPQSQFGSGLSGLWRSSEIFTVKSLAEWPGNVIEFFLGVSSIDVTTDGTGSLFASVNSSYQSVSLQWEVSTDSGATWAAVSGQTSETLSLTGQTAANDGDLYRLTGESGLRKAKSGTIQVQFETSISFTFFSNPFDQTVSSGQQAYFYVSASAEGATYGGYYTPAYQWQESSDSGSTWTNISGATSDSIAVNATASENGRQYRVRASAGGSEAFSSIATLTVT